MTDDGGPAFPRSIDALGGWKYAPFGMSLRDYFAAHALQALIARSRIADFITADYAEFAYACADAMLKERA